MGFHLPREQTAILDWQGMGSWGEGESEDCKSTVKGRCYKWQVCPVLVAENRFIIRLCNEAEQGLILSFNVPNFSQFSTVTLIIIF